MRSRISPPNLEQISEDLEGNYKNQKRLLTLSHSLLSSSELYYQLLEHNSNIKKLKSISKEAKTLQDKLFGDSERLKVSLSILEEKTSRVDSLYQKLLFLPTRMNPQVHLSIPYKSVQEASIVHQVLSVDQEPARGGVISKELSVQDKSLQVDITAKEVRSLRVSLNSLLDHTLLSSHSDDDEWEYSSSMTIPLDDVLPQKFQEEVSEEAFAAIEMAIRTTKNSLLESEENSDARKILVKRLIKLRIRHEDVKERLMSKSNASIETKGHTFVDTKDPNINYSHISPYWSDGKNKIYCQVCGTTIRIYMQYSQHCHDCGFCVHHACVPYIKRDCVGVKVRTKPDFIMTICPEKSLPSLNYQCSECQIEFVSSSSKLKPNLCDYTGLYYCSLCHWGSKVPLSQVSKQYLSLMVKKPVINIEKVNPRLFAAVHELNEDGYLCEYCKGVCHHYCFRGNGSICPQVCQYSDSLNWECTLSVALLSESDCMKWLTDFIEISKTNWKVNKNIALTNVLNKKVLWGMVYQCETNATKKLPCQTRVENSKSI
ncbi:unnamed protein product [Lepeophtheirus salmonis]|uniref:L antigen family member 3 n=1 Tax=Lepeophtheirus salmonis TaxID=72036 RepID=A0A7R8GZU3_LEPSM|nr:unnamed protein product [Lepeophtheirus salmonis]CAF2771361.1 unnamed protein product [Lepeophtheirus salmonis]